MKKIWGLYCFVSVLVLVLCFSNTTWASMEMEDIENEKLETDDKNQSEESLYSEETSGGNQSEDTFPVGEESLEEEDSIEEADPTEEAEQQENDVDSSISQETDVSDVFTITFFENDGTSSDDLRALTISGKVGTEVKLPSLPNRAGYVALGWTDKKKGNNIVAEAGSSYTITENMTFYMVNKKYEKIRFHNSNGKRAGFSNLDLNTKTSNQVILPELPKKNGYTSVGWSLSKNALLADYKAGQKITVSKETNLYAVYRKKGYYLVRYYNSSGSSEYKDMRKLIKASSYLTLSKLPQCLNYKAKGWTKSKASTRIYAVGDKIKVTGNIKLYSKYEKAVSVCFMNRSGSSEYTSLRITTNAKTIVLPSKASPKGYTFLGWSDEAGQTSYPKYLMGQTVTVKKGMKFYAVMKKRPINSYSNSQLKFSKKYDTVFFVGDSRTVGLQQTVEKAKGKTNKIKFFCQKSVTINWYRENKNAFLTMVKNTPGRKAIIFNLGVNNLRYTDMNGYLESVTNTYAAIMQQTEIALRGYNCSLYFMSVNPLNNKETVSTNYGGYNWGNRPPQWVRTFNSLLKNKLSGFTYIDTYTYLTNTGYESNDGLHYTDATYRKIYHKAISIIDG